tara:strand:- start:2340 stop:3368 length:1029 start_codon:yes stop_codon:yes gene_type:complete
MILAKTLAPEILEAISIGPDSSYLRNHTNLCETADLFATELDLMYDWKDTITKSNQLNAYRDFTKKFTLLGPELDTNMLIFFRDKINSGPLDVVNRVKYELNKAFETASNIKNPSKKKVSDSNTIDNDNQFLNALAEALQSCLAPCNYLEPTSESVGTHANKTDAVASSGSPLWDTTCEFLQAPIGMAVNTFNKINNHFAAEHASLSLAVENTYRSSLSLFFPKARVEKEKAAVAQGLPYVSTDNLPFTSDLSTTYNAFNNTNMITNIVAKILGDCHRISDFNRRFNYQDPNMNLGKAKDFYITVNNHGYKNTIDLTGKEQFTTPIGPSINDLVPYKYTNGC